MPQVDMPLSQLRDYMGSSPRPDDFDEYWTRAIRDLDNLELNRGFDPVWEDSEFRVGFARCVDLYFTGVGGARIHARCVFPLDARVDGHPALLKFHGYSQHAGDWSTLLPYAAEGYFVLALDVRGQGGNSNDPGTFGAQGTISAPGGGSASGAGGASRAGRAAGGGEPGSGRHMHSGPTLRGHIVRGIESGPDALFYRSVFLDTVALARIAAGIPEVDANRLGSFGGSQGGALALACAALEPRIRHCVPVYPFLSDYLRVWELENGNTAYEEIRHYLKRRDPRHEHAEALFTKLGYIDVQHLAPWVRASVLMFTGLMDDTCPPSTQFAVYNRLTCEKNMLLYPDFGHEPLPDERDITLKYFRERFGA